MSQRLLHVILLAGIWLFPASRAHSQTLDDTGLWFAMFGNGEFESLGDQSPLRWWFDAPGSGALLCAFP